MWPKGNSIEDVVVIGEEEGGMYKLKGHSETTLVQVLSTSCEQSSDGTTRLEDQT